MARLYRWRVWPEWRKGGPLMTLYERVKAEGGYISNHESDLYIEVNDPNRVILARYPIEQSNARIFTNRVTGKRCYDIPFAYDPWWNEMVAR